MTALAWWVAALPAMGQDASVASADPAAGSVYYVAACARCHGVDGAGGEGPPLDRPELPRAPTDDELTRIIRRGIPGTGMTGTGWLAESEVAEVVRYVRSLAPSGASAADDLPGDPAAGRTVYEARGCGGCHTIGGFGTARGPDLSTVGVRRSAAHVRESIVDPAAALPRGTTAMPRRFVDYLMVRVVDADGRVVRGMRMNEDSYTIQLKDAAGVVHSFYKPALRDLLREFDRSLMQSYADALSDEQIDDLVAYLMTLDGRRARSVS